MTGAADQTLSKIDTWRVRAALSVFLLVAVVTVVVTNWLLTARFTETTRNDAELELARHSGALTAELRQQRVVPQLLARDATLSTALASGDHAQSTQRLFDFVDEIGAASLILLDETGRVVASTNRSLLGTPYADQTFFQQAMDTPDTLFTVAAHETRGFGHFFARRIADGPERLGVLVLELDLARFERTWAGIAHAVMVTDADGTVLLATEPRWRGQTVAEALALESPQSAIQRAVQTTTGWTALPADAFVQGEAVMRQQIGLPHEGWQMHSFTTYASVRDRVNSVLAMVIMGFAILLALAFYAVSRRSALRLALSAREKAELRRVNARLQQEIAERERVQENLAVAEQSLEQSSKLAALGEMSAAVSHELNQPLAAMKTYLAGARLLLRRNRPDEALAAFGRLDELIERMSAITRQLKSYARKGQDDLTPVNLQDSLAASLSMMAPQLRERQVTILRNLPDGPVEVLGDSLRIEQVIINLLRNALDATKATRDPWVEIMLAAGETTATLTIRDNGPGIADHSALFEPFYTTKQPGDGVGLGLAISSGIVAELGGRLTARNGQSGGAVFEMQLPLLTRKTAVPDKPAAE